MMKTLDRSNAILKVGMAHFQFEISGRKVAYCYIRKNACSAFKDMICATSEHAKKIPAGSDQLKFLQEHHRIRTARQLRNCDLKVFVYRDPYERLISVFVNKFVARSANGSIFRNYQKITGKAPEDTTFRTFVESYCKPDFSDRDPHISPQANHLLPIRYNAALPISGLHGSVVEMFGQEIADRFFLSKKNSSEYGDGNDPQIDESSETLHRRFGDTQSLPGKACFEDADLRSRVQQTYDADYKMLEKLS